MLDVSVVMTATWPQPNQQPVPQYPPTIRRFASDWECDDPRHGETRGYIPRVYGEKDTIPEAFKYGNGDPMKMTLPWAKLWFDCFGFYTPRAWDNMPPNWNDGVDWSWITQKDRVLTERQKWWLHLIHAARAFTNKMSIPDPDRYDPITGVGYGTTPFGKEQVTTGGNYVWDAGNGRMWCLDGLAPPPPAELLRDKFYWLHIGTQSSPDVWDATKRPEWDCPNGIWKRPGFPQAGDNIVVHPLISTWDAGATMTWNGIPLRQDVMPAVRVKAWPQSYAPWPLIPDRPLIYRV